MSFRQGRMKGGVKEDYDRLNTSGERGQPMKETSVPEIERKLEGVRTAFEQWRSVRKKRERIPGNLWEAAMDLSTGYSTCRIARALRLDYKELRHRIRERSSGRSSGEFIEVKAEQLFSPMDCVVEMRSPDGFEIRIQAGSSFQPQLPHLIGCFLRGGR